MLTKIIYELGVRLRNPSLNGHVNYLKKTDKFAVDKLEEIQYDRLISLVEFAYENSKYYRDLFDSVDIVPQDIKTLSDLTLIPLTTKRNLIEQNETIVPSIKFKRTRTIETSGTTGESLKFIKDEKWDSANRAALFRYYDWYGVKPWDRNGYFWGYNIKSSEILRIKIEDFLQNRFRLFSYSEDKIKEFTAKLVDAKYLHGYSSMIYEVAKVVNRLNLHDRYNLNLIKGTSEKIYEKYQQEVEKAFGRRIVSEYGAGESGLIAFECPEEHKMHINMQNVILEEVDGQAVVTNLLSYSFPVIRYNLGDYIKLASKDYKCPCGRSAYVLEEVLGRVGKLIHGKINNYPSLILYYVSKNLYQQEKILINYQGVQNEKGKLTMRIEQDELKYKEKILRELKKYVKDDLEIEILFNQNLHRMDGKLKDFISTIEE